MMVTTHYYIIYTIMKEIRNRNQTWKARIGAIGENQVVSKLLQEGWDAFNANCTIKNNISLRLFA